MVELAEDLEHGHSAGAGPVRVVTAFVRALLLREVDRALALQTLTLALHPACLVSQDTLRGAVPQIRKHPLRELGKIEPGTAASLVAGTSPNQGYCYDPERFELVVASEVGGSATEEGAEAVVEPVTTGAPPTHPTTRQVRLLLHQGRWRVRWFDQLAMPTQPPNMTSQRRSHSTGVGDYVVPLPMRREEGLHKVDIEATRRRRRYQSRESSSARLARQRGARHETSELASNLSAAEINQRCAIEPCERTIVTVTKTGRLSRKRLKKGQLFRPSLGSGGFHIETAGEAEDKARVLQEEEDSRKRDALRRRISATMKKIHRVAATSAQVSRNRTRSSRAQMATEGLRVSG